MNAPGPRNALPFKIVRLGKRRSEAINIELITLRDSRIVKIADLPAPSVEEVISNPKTPQEIYRLRHSLKPGDIFMLNNEKLTPFEMELLLAYSSERGCEILLRFSIELGKYIYGVGTEGRANPSSAQKATLQRLGETPFGLHTHPKVPVRPSQNDKKYFDHNLSQRNFIGGNLSNGWNFREFDHNGEEVGDILDVDRFTDLINSIVTSSKNQTLPSLS